MAWPQLSRINSLVPKWYQITKQLKKLKKENRRGGTVDVVGVENKVAFSFTIGIFLVIFKGKFLSQMVPKDHSRRLFIKPFLTVKLIKNNFVSGLSYFCMFSLVLLDVVRKVQFDSFRLDSAERFFGRHQWNRRNRPVLLVQQQNWYRSRKLRTLIQNDIEFGPNTSSFQWLLWVTLDMLLIGGLLIGIFYLNRVQVKTFQDDLSTKIKGYLNDSNVRDIDMVGFNE